MARKTVTPKQHLATLTRALDVAIAKGMTSEAKQVTARLRELRADIARQTQD